MNQTALVQSVEWTGQAEGSKVNILRSASSSSSNHNWMGSSQKLSPCNHERCLWPAYLSTSPATSHEVQTFGVRQSNILTLENMLYCLSQQLHFACSREVLKTASETIFLCFHPTILSQQPVSRVWASVWFHCKLCTFSWWPPRLLTTVWMVKNYYF